ncbi:hypothetical protein HDU76_000654 [Blyttiomyces sp. JEL0837]|nr:hypothetical protein HDU76_000654 [Blyttiomyces sp. JEL0837]
MQSTDADTERESSAPDLFAARFESLPMIGQRVDGGGIGQNGGLAPGVHHNNQRNSDEFPSSSNGDQTEITDSVAPTPPWMMQTYIQQQQQQQSYAYPPTVASTATHALSSVSPSSHVVNVNMNGSSVVTSSAPNNSTTSSYQAPMISAPVPAATFQPSMTTTPAIVTASADKKDPLIASNLNKPVVTVTSSTLTPSTTATVPSKPADKPLQSTPTIVFLPKSSILPAGGNRSPMQQSSTQLQQRNLTPAQTLRPMVPGGAPTPTRQFGGGNNNFQQQQQQQQQQSNVPSFVLNLQDEVNSDDSENGDEDDDDEDEAIDERENHESYIGISAEQQSMAFSFAPSVRVTPKQVQNGQIKIQQRRVAKPPRKAVNENSGGSGQQQQAKPPSEVKLVSPMDGGVVKGLHGIVKVAVGSKEAMELDLEEGDAIVLFEAFSDGTGYGVNLTSSTGGLLPLTSIKFTVTPESPDGLFVPVDLSSIKSWRINRDIRI